MAHALFCYGGKKSVECRTLADKAIHWERYLLEEKGGYQDQIFAAYGGFNHIKFNKDSSYEINKFKISNKFRNDLENQSIICYVPIKRFSYLNSVANHLNEKKTITNLISIKNTVSSAIEILKSSDINALGELLNKYWKIKRSLPNVSNQIIDEVYDKALKNGAIGGKILGAVRGIHIIHMQKIQ